MQIKSNLKRIRRRKNEKEGKQDKRKCKEMNERENQPSPNDIDR